MPAVILRYENKEIKVSNPDKYLWPELEIKKIDYIHHLIKLAPFILKHISNRPLTVIRYPNGVHEHSFYQKHLPDYSPKWVDHIRKNKEKYIILNTLPVLVWLGNQAALEFHATFNRIAHPNNPEAIVFDLDPSEGQNFEDVAHAALLIRDTLSSLQITSFPKTSGASGLQIYIPVGHRYTYEQARNINGFFGSYFSSKYPHFFTIERTVNKRGRKIYFDYLQMWSNKTIISPYSPRAVDTAAVSTPITWKELEKGCRPEDFTLLNIHSRLKQKGDLFNNLYIPESYQNLSFILENISE